MANIVVVGSMNMDFVAAVKRVPGEGETVLSPSMRLHAGGKGGNQACAAAKLGARVVMLGAVGADEYGDKLIENLSGAGVDTRHIKRASDTHTGMAWIAVSERGDNSIIVIPGANMAVDTEYIDEHAAVIAACDTVVMQLEIPLETVLYTARLAKRLGKRVILDPAPAVQHLPQGLLACADVVKPNESELATLLGDPDAASHLREAAEALRALGARDVAVTLGGEGAYLLCEDGQERRFDARKVRVVDTTAAGDSFTAALAVTLSAGQPLCEAVPFAMRVAEIVVTRAGAQDSIPTLEEVQKALA